MKVGKEEIMGLLAAVEQWVLRDHDAEWKEWERRLEVIANAVTRFESVTTTIKQPGRSNVAPVLSIDWREEFMGISSEEVCRQLSQDQPRIETSAHTTGISIMPYMMEDGEAEIVAERLVEIFTASVRGTVVQCQ